MLACILLQEVAGLLLAAHRQFLRVTAMCVRRELRGAGLTSLPSELLYRIVEYVHPERTQTSGSQSQGTLLALSQ